MPHKTAQIAGYSHFSKPIASHGVFLFAKCCRLSVRYREDNRRVSFRSMHLGLFAVIIFLFAAWMTVHVQLCFILMRRSLFQGAIGFFVFPLAPYWAHKAKIPKLPHTWVVLFSFYFLALTAGFI